MDYLAQLFIAFLAILFMYHWLQPRLISRRLARITKTRVKHLRLNKMLEFIGLDVDQYIDTVPANLIEAHIRRCQGCKQTRQCDDCLLDKRPVHDMHFCPNYESLMRCSRRFVRPAPTAK